jgi:hypothetical protein
VPKAGGLPDGTGVAVDVNTHGTILAREGLQPVVWQNNKTTALGAPAGVEAPNLWATAINNSGVIVGYGLLGDGWHGLWWNAASPSVPHDLGEGVGWLQLTGISDDGTMVGESGRYEATGGSHWFAVSGTATSGFTALPGQSAGSTYGTANYTKGTYVTGRATPAGSTQDQPMFWAAGTPHVVPLEGPVNSWGMVAGPDAGDTHVEVWYRGHTWTLPQLVSGRDSSQVGDVLESGGVAGSSYDAGGVNQPVYWTPSDF